MSDCCCIYVDEGPEICREEIRRARKHHECCECGDEIKPGDKYQYVTGKWYGEWSVFKTCFICSRIREDLFKCGFHYGGLAEELWECYGVEL